MKKILTQLMIGALVISWMPVHAGLGKSLQDTTYHCLQSMSKNPALTTAMVALISTRILCTALIAVEIEDQKNILLQDPPLSVEERRDKVQQIGNEARVIPVVIATIAAFGALVGLGASTVAKWLTSN